MLGDRWRGHPPLFMFGNQGLTDQVEALQVVLRPASLAFDHGFQGLRRRGISALPSAISECPLDARK
jgi:hypothetical protein